MLGEFSDRKSAALIPKIKGAVFMPGEKLCGVRQHHNAPHDAMGRIVATNYIASFDIPKSQRFVPAAGHHMSAVQRVGDGRNVKFVPLKGFDRTGRSMVFGPHEPLVNRTAGHSHSDGSDSTANQNNCASRFWNTGFVGWTVDRPWI